MQTLPTPAAQTAPMQHDSGCSSYASPHNIPPMRLQFACPITFSPPRQLLMPLSKHCTTIRAHTDRRTTRTHVTARKPHLYGVESSMFTAVACGALHPERHFFLQQQPSDSLNPVADPTSLKQHTAQQR
jgi:hypothetical protein